MGDELTEEELELVVGGIPWEDGKELAEKLRDSKSRIIEADVNKDGKLVGDEITKAKLDGLVKHDESSRKI